MCVYIRCCLATVVAAAVIFMPQVSASDDKSKIPRISVAATATGAGPASQGGHSPVPEQEALQEETGDSSNTGAAARKTQGLSQAISDPSLHLESSGQLATKVADDNAGTVREQPGHNKAVTSQPETDNAMKDAVSAFSITEVTKPESVSLPTTPQVQHETPPKYNPRAEPQGPHGHPESSNKQTKEAETQNNAEFIQPAAASTPAIPQAEPEHAKGPPPETSHPQTAKGSKTDNAMKDVEPAFSITEVTKSEAVSHPAIPQVEHETPTEHTPRAEPQGPHGDPESANKQTKVAESQMKAELTTVTEIIKPAAASTPATPQAEPEHAKGSPPETSHPQTTEGSKDAVPQINVAVTKMIKPVAGSSAALPRIEPALGTGNAATTVGEADPVKHSTTKEAKVEGPAVSSEPLEVSEKQFPAPLIHPLPAKVIMQGPATRRSVFDQPGGQPLTTIIKPVHAIQPEGGGKTTQNTNITPISGVPENVLGEGAKYESKKPNAYTITPNEFAKKTAVAHALKLEEESKESTATVLENMPDKHASHLEAETGKAATAVPETAPTQGQDHNSDKHESKTPTDKTISKTNNGEENQEQSKKITHGTVEEEKPLKSSNHTENLSLMTVSGLVNTITNELKAFSEEVTKKWNERREKISWLGEAMEVLKTYNDKITETENYSNCTTNDRKKYQDKSNSIKLIIDNCEMALKRKDWHELQEKTSNILNEIRLIEEDYEAQISQIPKGDTNFNARKLVVEDNVKRKLQQVNTESIKNEFSKLRDNALRIDEEDYKTCIENKETDAKGTAIISEIRLAIMMIYGCV